MKKLFALMMIASMFSIVSCGPSAEEKAKVEADAKAQADSLLNASQQTPEATATADSTAILAAPDSMTAK